MQHIFYYILLPPFLPSCLNQNDIVSHLAASITLSPRQASMAQFTELDRELVAKMPTLSTQHKMHLLSYLRQHGTREVCFALHYHIFSISFAYMLTQLTQSLTHQAHVIHRELGAAFVGEDYVRQNDLGHSSSRAGQSSVMTR